MAVVESDVEVDPRDDDAPGIWLGVQAIFGTIWWILIMFVYVKNSDSDTLPLTSGADAGIPLAWWWN